VQSREELSQESDADALVGGAAALDVKKLDNALAAVSGQKVAWKEPRPALQEAEPEDKVGELVEHVERRVAAEKAAEDSAANVAAGKPAQSPEIVAKRVEGSVQKFLKEVSLLNQAFVKNDKQTVEQMLKAAGTTVSAFTLYVVGEGIEKKVDDFAAEVAAQVAAAQGTAA
jgi:translation elongation factor EF-Ts